MEDPERRTVFNWRRLRLPGQVMIWIAFAAAIVALYLLDPLGFMK